MPGSNKTERNRQLKANRDAGLGDEMGRLPARVKDAGITMMCLVCKSELKCTKTNTELKRHAEGKHGKADYEECFPGAEVHRAALEEKVSKDRKVEKGDGLTKAQRKKKAEVDVVTEDTEKMASFKSYFPSSLYAPTATTAAATGVRRADAPGSAFSHPAAGFAAASSQEYGLDYFLKGALAGGICCSVTHGALTPVDVVKTRMQLDPAKYTGMVSGFQKVIAEEGAGGLLTGLGPTAFGYFVQGWFKFGGVEYFKIQASQSMTPQQTWDNRNAIYLGSSAAAEFIADIFLCPLEATRIRLVSNPTYADGMLSCMTKLAREEGVIGAFYSGFGPILAKQVPYTMTKFAVQGIAAEKIYDSLGKTPKEMSSSENISVSLASGVVAGVAAAIISHPADTLLSKINKAGAGGSGGMFSRLGNIAAETGLWKLCTQGLGARCVMIGTLTAGQFGLFDIVMNATGASKFHFHNPESDDH